MNKIKADVLIVGTGASGLFAALHSFRYAGYIDYKG